MFSAGEVIDDHYSSDCRLLAANAGDATAESGAGRDHPLEAASVRIQPIQVLSAPRRLTESHSILSIPIKTGRKHSTSGKIALTKGYSGR